MKPQGVTGRVRRLLVDGRAIDGTMVPLPAQPGGTVEVEAHIAPA
jgi:hypothetical protein